MSKVKRAGTLRGISYCRVSTLGQIMGANGKVKEDSSPEAQKQRCISHIKFLESTRRSKGDLIEYDLVDHFADEGFSGKNTNRPAYQKMWDMIASGVIDFIIAPELSRLSRNIMDFLELVAHCKKYEVDIIIIGLDLDTSNPMGKILIVILVALAQFEREMTAYRVKENVLARLLKDGKINGAAEILGLDRDPEKKGHFLPNKEELARVENILNLFQKFNSRRKTLDVAKEMGLAGKSGQELTARMIDTMLDNVKWRYRGLWYANSENKDVDSKLIAESKRFQIVQLPHGPLLNEKLLDEVQVTLDNIKKVQRQTGKDDYVYLLKNILYCEDGTKFHSEPSKSRQYRYYFNKKNNIRLRCDQFDPFLITEVKKSFLENDRFAEILEKAIKRRQADLPKIEMQIRNLKKELSDVSDSDQALQKHLTDKSKILKPEFMDWLGKQVEQIAGRRQSLEKELEFLERCKGELLRDSGLENIRGEVKKLMKEFDELGGVEKRRLIERIIQKIVIDNSGKVEVEIYGDLSKKGVTYRPLPLSSTRSVTLRNGSSELKENGGVDGT